MNNYIDIEVLQNNFPDVINTAVQNVQGEVKIPSDYLMGIDYVKDAIIIGNGDTVIVSVLTTPIYMSSVRNEVTEQIIETVKSNLNVSNIYVNYDTDIYYKSSRATDEKEFQSILNTVLERN